MPNEAVCSNEKCEIVRSSWSLVGASSLSTIIVAKKVSNNDTSMSCVGCYVAIVNLFFFINFHVWFLEHFSPFHMSDIVMNVFLWLVASNVVILLAMSTFPLIVTSFYFFNNSFINHTLNFLPLTLLVAFVFAFL